MSATGKKPYTFGRNIKAIQLQYSFDVLDQFHEILQTAVSQSQRKTQEIYDGLNPNSFECESHMEAYQSYLEDDFYQLGEVQKLAHALALSALYRQIETQTKRVLRVTFPAMGKGKIDLIVSGKPQSEIDVSTLVGFAAVEELRLLNNIIKHADNKVNDKLAAVNPIWEKNSELKDLDKTYERLKPLVRDFMRAFINEAYDRSEEFETATNNS